MKKIYRISLYVFLCLFFGMYISSHAQKDSVLCVKIDSYGMYAPRGEIRFLLTNIQRIRSSGVHDTLCRLISFADTVYVTDANARWTVETHHRECYGLSKKNLRNPLWVLHIKGPLCGKLSTMVCQSADYYDRGNRRWIPMKRLKSVGNPKVDITLESSDCQLLFQFED